jgi:hypothetical protein
MRRVVVLSILAIGLSTAEVAHGQFRAEISSVGQLEAALPSFGPLSGSNAHVGTSIVHQPEGPVVGTIALGATGGWIVGAAIGFGIGYLIQPERPQEYAPASDAAMIGLVAGMVLGPPVGAHLTNRQQGNLGLSSAGSLAAFAGGLLVTVSIARAAVDAPPTAMVLLTPLAQVATVTVIEWATSR